MIRNQKISTCAIICIDEHEDRITSNLRHLIQSNFFDEVVLLINGSTDYIEKVAGRFVEDYSIKIIDLNWYLNTSYAISTNVKCFVSDIIVFIKDINDTNRNYQSELIAPLILDKINLTKNKSIKSGYSKSTNTIKNLKGNRAIWKKDIPEFLDTIRQQDDDLQTAMKRYFKVFKASQNSFEASAIKFQFSNNSLPIFLIETNDYLERAYANMQLTGQGNIKIFLN